MKYIIFYTKKIKMEDRQFQDLLNLIEKIKLLKEKLEILEQIENVIKKEEIEDINPFAGKKNMILTKENYHSIEANRQYMSVSLFKELAFGCQAKQMAKLNGNFKEEQADALLIGQAVHSWNEGTYDRFMSEHPEMYKKDGTLYAKYEIIGDLIETLKNDASMLRALEGKKEVILTAEMFGVDWKIMIDSYNEEKGIISDLKTMKSIDDKF